MKRQIRILSLLPALLGLDTTRHLMEYWPQPPEKTATQFTAPASPTSRHLRAQVAEVSSMLLDIRNALATSTDESCRGTASSALALLGERFEDQSARLSSDRIEEFIDAVRGLEAELAECRQNHSLSKWLFEKNTGLKGSAAAEIDSESNPNGEDAATAARQNTLKADLSVEGAYRSHKSWHSAEILGSFARLGDLGTEIDYDFRQANVLQLGPHALRISGSYARKGEWLWNDDRRGINKSYGIAGGWRKVRISGKALEIIGRYSKSELAPSIWGRTQLAAETSYVFKESLHDELKFVGTLSRETLKDLDASLWITSVGVTYEQTQGSRSSLSLRLAMQDRRISKEGAGLWPEFYLGVEGKKIQETALYPSASLEISPDSTPWSPHTLTARSRAGLNFVSGRLEMPTDFAIGQIFHGATGGQGRQDRFLEFAFKPRYKISDSASLALNTSWRRYWILKSDINPATLAVNYPRNSYKNFETVLRLLYEF